MFFIKKCSLIIGILLSVTFVYAQRNITISTSATSNGSWNDAGDPAIFTPSGDNANILNTEIQTRLGTKSVTITTAGGGAQAGNITFSTTITATPTVTGKTFTVTAAGTITVNTSSSITLTPATSGSTISGNNLTFNAGTGISISSAITTSGGTSNANWVIGGAGGTINLQTTSGAVTTSAAGTITSVGATCPWGLSGAVGGSFTCSGSSVNLGAAVVTSGAGPGAGQTVGGNGGAISITASTTDISTSNLTTSGGNGFGIGAGGAGGNITFTANNGNISAGVITTSGGNAVGTFLGGVGGNITVTDHSGTTSITSITAIAGNPGNGNGSVGGTISINATTPTGGNVTIGAINNSGSNGGSTSNYNGGNGGPITIKSSSGFINCTSTITSTGGTSYNTSVAGTGGALTLAASTNVTISGAVNLSGGAGSATNWARAAGGGALIINATTGNVSTAALTTSGGSAGMYERGGVGGNISITANSATTVTVGAITTTGGNAAGNGNFVGSNGGAVSISAITAAFTSSSAITTNGGNASPSNTNGGTGGAVTIAAATIAISGGVTISTIGGTPNGSGTSTGGAVTLTGSGGLSLAANITTTASTTNGLLTINNGNSTLTSGGLNDGQTANIFNCGSADFTKTGAGNLAIGGGNTYTGNTVVSAGTLTLSAADRISNSSILKLNGGTFSTGTTTGYNETLGILNLNANSTIALGTGAHSLTFSNSSGQAWAGSTLTITGWTGTGATSGTAGKIYVGVGGLSAGQLAKITFSGYSGCQILGTGELVPTTLLAISYYSKSTGNLDVLSNWGTATDGTGSAPADFTTNNCTYNIRNNATPTIGANWTVAGTASKVIVGDGTAACNFTIPSGFTLTSTSPVVIDVSANATLTIANTTIPTLGTLNATSKIDYAVPTGGQTVTAATYGNLTMSNTSGTQTAAGNIIVNGEFVTTSGGTLDLGTSATLSGTLSTITNDGTIKTSVPTATSAIPIPTGKTWGGTIEYARAAGVQTVMAGTYNNLTVSNSSGSQTTSGSITVNGTLTTTSGGTLDLGASSILSGTLSTITNGGTIKTSVPTGTSATPIPSGKTWDGTIEYALASGSQTAMAGTYNNVTFSNTSGTQSASGNITVNGTLVTTSGGTLDMSTNVLDGTLGTITNGGIILTSNTSTLPIPTGKTWGGTIRYSATTGSQTIVAGTYATLTILNSSGINTVEGNFSASGTLTTTAGGALSIPCGITVTTTSTFTNAGIITGALSGASWSRIVNSVSVANSGTIGSATTSLALSGTITGGAIVNNGVNVVQSSGQAAVCGLTPPVLTAAIGATVDNPFDITFIDDPAWRAAITSITIDGTTLTVGSFPDVNKITFTPSASNPTNLLQTSGTKTFVVTAAGYVNTSVSQTIAPGVATNLAMSTQPPAMTVSGNVFSTQPVVLIQDQYGNTTTSTANVTAIVGVGGWSIGGTTVKAGVNGISTFTDLTSTIATAVNGATITFTSPGLIPISSSTFNLKVYVCSSSCTKVSGATNYSTTAANQEFCLESGTWTGNITISHTDTKVCIAGTWNPATGIVSHYNNTIFDNAGIITAPTIDLSSGNTGIEFRNELFAQASITTTNGGLGGTIMQAGSTLTNYGTYITNGFANAINGLIDNKTGGVLVDTSSLIMFIGNLSPNTTNNGIIRKNGGTIELNLIDKTFTNNGTILNQALGNFTINGANFTNNGTLTYQGVTDLIKSPTSGSVITNTGTWTNNYTGNTSPSFKFENLEIFNNSGTLYNNKGDMNLYNGVAITNLLGGTITANNGNVVFTNTATITNTGDFNITGTGGMSSPCNNAVFTNNGNMTIENGDLDWDNNGNTYINNGLLTLETTGNSIDIGGIGTSTFTNNGSVLAPNMSVLNNGTLQNKSTIQISEDFTFNNAGAGGIFGPLTSSGNIGRIQVAAVTNWISGVYGAAAQSLDFCDASGGLDNGWDNDGNHIPAAGGTYTFCTPPLPIKLIDFTAITQNNSVELNWITGSEINNDFFTLYRSKDGFEFEPIAEISGAGNSSHLNSYNYNDDYFIAGISYYQLSQTDYDGTQTFSKIISVNQKIGTFTLNKLTNENGSILEILFANPSLENTIIITNNNGEIIYKNDFLKTVKTKIAINLPNGIYILSNVTDCNTDTLKFIVK